MLACERKAALGIPQDGCRTQKTNVRLKGLPASDAEIQSYLDCARFQRRLSDSLKIRRAQSDDGYLIKEEAGPNDMSLEVIRANLPVGSVNHVIDRMLEEISVLWPSHVALQTQLGDFDQRTMLRQIELWGTRIIPAIRQAIRSSSAAAQPDRQGLLPV